MLNTNKKYVRQPFMLGEEPGIYDSINMDQEVFDLYKRAIAQMWTEDEFNYAPCKAEFAEDNDGKDLMVDTLKYQWRADSLACNLYTLLQPFISNDQITQLILFNTFIECVHSGSYSEIVKNAFPDPVKTIEDLSADEVSSDRLETVSKAFCDLHQVGLDYTLGKVTREEVYADVYKGVVALYLLERIQFICSFAVTFSLGELGRFQPVAMAVRKICADETVIHAETDLLILKDMQKDPLWESTNTPEFQETLTKMVDEVIGRECAWVDQVFEGRKLPGLTPELLKEWAMFNAQIVKDNLGLKHDGKHKVNPLPFLKGWISSNTTQVANQEQNDGVQYLIGGISNDTDDVDIDLDF